MPVIRIGHTPDADDAFMYYAIAHGHVPVGGFQVEHVLEDIQTLNHRALTGELEGTAISAGAYPQVADKYRHHARRLVHRAQLRPNGGCHRRARRPADRGRAHRHSRRVHHRLPAAAPVRAGFEALPMAFDSIVGAVQRGDVAAGCSYTRAR